MLLVLTGKTASGKDTIKSALLSKFPSLKKIITTTSRTPRTGEVDGVDYYFLTKEGFENKIKEGEFAEHVEYGGNLYGTYKSELRKVLTDDVLWRIDPSRAGKVREFLKTEELTSDVVVIYITVSDEVVLNRLQNRGLSEEEIQKRMNDDKKIWEEYKDNYDFLIENIPDKLNEAVDKIIRILKNHSA